MKSQINSLQAFSLLEMSIVLTIIGLLVAGALNASFVINRVRLSNARSMTENSPVRDITGLVAWYETTQDSSFATGEVYDSYADSPNNVSQWYDTSPASMALRTTSNNQVLTITTSSSISYVQDGIGHLPSFNFSRGCFRTTSFRNGNLDNASIFIVLQPTNITTSLARDIFDSGRSSSGFNNILTISASQITINRGTALSGSSSGAFVANQPAIAAFYLSNTSGAYVNSVNTLAVSGNAGNNPLSGVCIGRRRGASGGSGNDFNGLISEVIIFNQTLKVSDRRNVMNYLSKKYKISVEGL